MVNAVPAEGRTAGTPQKSLADSRGFIK